MEGKYNSLKNCTWCVQLVVVLGDGFEKSNFSWVEKTERKNPMRLDGPFFEVRDCIYIFNGEMCMLMKYVHVYNCDFYSRDSQLNRK